MFSMKRATANMSGMMRFKGKRPDLSLPSWSQAGGELARPAVITPWPECRIKLLSLLRERTTGGHRNCLPKVMPITIVVNITTI
jgi:hypothetical protein